MIIEDIKNIDSSPKELRKFALTMAISLLIICGLFAREYYRYFLIASALFLCPGLLVPIILLPLQKVWMTFAVIMGWFMTRLILCILFFGILTPIALVMKVLGKDILDTKFDKDSSETYWLARKANESQKPDYTKQF